MHKQAQPKEKDEKEEGGPTLQSLMLFCRLMFVFSTTPTISAISHVLFQGSFVAESLL